MSWSGIRSSPGASSGNIRSGRDEDPASDAAGRPDVRFGCIEPDLKKLGYSFRERHLRHKKPLKAAHMLAHFKPLVKSF